MLKYNWFYYVLFIFSFILIYPYIFDAKLFLGGDNAAYYSLAQGIASDFKYIYSNSPISLPANHYPPGYPFILAIAIKLGVTSLTGLKIVNGLFLLGSVFFTFLLSLQFTNNKVFSGLIAFATLLNMHLLEYSSITMSEVPFVFFMLFTFYSFVKFVESNYKLKSWSFFLAVFGVIALVYIRTQGIAIIGAFIFYLILEKKFKIAGILTICFILGYLPWQIRNSSLGGNTYIAQLLKVNPYEANSKKMDTKDWGTRIKNNSVRYVSKEIPSLIFPVKPTVYNDPSTGNPTPASSLQWFLGCLIIGFSLFGIWSIKKARWLLLSFFGSNFVIFLLWPDVWFGIRFILPLAPLILISFFIGIKSLLGLFIKHDFVQSGRIYPLFVLPYLLINYTTIKILHEKSEGKYAPNWANYLLVAEWAKDNLKRTDVVVTRKPELFFFIADTKTKTFPYTDDLDVLKADFDSLKVTHVMFEQLGFTQTGKYLYPLLVKETDRFTMLYSLGARDATDKDGNKIKTPDGAWLYEYHRDKGYFGKYKNGLKEGKGSYIYANGSKFEGNWVNDTIEGAGIFYEPNGNNYKGNWVKGNREGKFIITIPEKNQRIESFWKNNIIEAQGYFLDSLGNRLNSAKLK
jgi:hypothetical protein